jgi:hypothetical protein
MAYIGAVEYDAGGRIRSLDGLAAVMYDDGAKRNLLGWNLGAVKYDDGGRFRTLVGLGQDATDIVPPDVGVDTSLTSAFPISYTPPSPAPSFIPFVPSPTVDTQSAPITGTLLDTTPPAAPPPTTNLLTSIFSGVQSVISAAAPLAAPATAGKTVATAAPAAAPATASWLTQASVPGLPNWGLLAGVGVVGVLFMLAMSGGGSRRRRNPGRRRHRNPAELILMGANPRRGWVH